MAKLGNIKAARHHIATCGPATLNPSGLSLTAFKAGATWSVVTYPAESAAYRMTPLLCCHY